MTMVVPGSLHAKAARQKHLVQHLLSVGLHLSYGPGAQVHHLVHHLDHYAHHDRYHTHKVTVYKTNHPKSPLQGHHDPFHHLRHHQI